MSLIKDTRTRVVASSPCRWNERIARRLRENVVYYASHPEEIDARIGELDREWDIERTLEANASSLMLLFLILGTLWTHWLYILSAAVGFFLLLHAVQGWCPPVPFFRRRGIRTTGEIDQERYALKALRGDFAGFEKNPGERNPEVWGAEALKAAE